MKDPHPPIYPSREAYLQAALLNEKEKNNRLRDEALKLREQLREVGKRRK